MKISQKRWEKNSGWKAFGKEKADLEGANLVLAFGGRDALSDPARFNEIKKMYPKSRIVSASTAGEIMGVNVHDDSISCTAIQLDKASIEVAQIEITNGSQSEEVGQRLAKKMKKDGLAYLMLISDGLLVNGTALLSGVNKVLEKNTVVTGGLAGDGSRFVKTIVGVDAPPSVGKVVGIGFYGDFKIGYGSVGGWDAFGPNRRVTRSKGNVLYEIDSQPALALYKKYLGEQAKDLPGSGLLFPLSITVNGGTKLVRTILSVNENENSMTFAGDIPEGCEAQLMKANFERLIDGAQQAASNAHQIEKDSELAILISCVGRKLVLGPRIEEEIDAVREVLGEAASVTGFYSYGELCPNAKDAPCELHNQTMTITTLSER